MWIYIFKRLCLIIPTLLGIMTLNFFIVQMAPGGPVEQMLSKIEHNVLQGETSMGGFSSTTEVFL